MNISYIERRLTKMGLEEVISESKKGVVLRLQVKPNSKKQELVIDSSNSITIFVKAPPDKGKANKELLKFIAKILKKSSSEITIVAGLTSRDKTIVIQNDDKLSIQKKLIEHRS
ncbi:MAG: YggU family protein [Asgard group archaeon]|nr:YggU family protein [Asgard group archaeon]